MTALMGLAARLRLARLYLSTDARSDQDDLAQFLAAAFAGGVDIVQIRQKGMARKAELEALETARTAAIDPPGHRLRQRLGRARRRVPRRHAASRPDRWSVRPGAAPAAPVGAARPVHPQSGAGGRSLGRSGRQLFHRRTRVRDLEQAGLSPGRSGTGALRREGRSGDRRVVEAVVRDRRDRRGQSRRADHGRSAPGLGGAADHPGRGPAAAAGELRRGLQAAWKAEPGMDRYIQHALANG